MTSGTEEIPTTFSALCIGAAIGVLFGAVFVATLTGPQSVTSWWIIASGYLLLGLLSLTGTAAVVGAPVWFLTGRAGVSGVRRLWFLALAAVVTALALGLVLGVITGQVRLSVFVVLLAMLWCCFPAAILSKPLSRSRRAQLLSIGLVGLVTVIAGITIIIS